MIVGNHFYNTVYTFNDRKPRTKSAVMQYYCYPVLKNIVLKKQHKSLALQIPKMFWLGASSQNKVDVF